MDAQAEELPSQRLAKVKLSELSLLEQITQQGVDLKELRNEMRLSREESISEDTNTRLDKAAKDNKTAFAKAAKESKAGLDTATATITSRLDNLLRPLQGFLSVSERKQENRIIGLVNRKKGGDAWVPLPDLTDNAIDDVTSMSISDKAMVTGLEKYAERVGFPKEILPQQNRDKLVEVLRAIWGGEL